MKRLLLAGIAGFAVAGGVAHAGNIVTFAQTAGVNTVAATTNPADTQTTLRVTDADVAIGELVAGTPPVPTLFSMTATSFDAASSVSAAVIQHYNGSFCLTSGPGCSGENVVSGTFTDAAFGALGGDGLTVNVANPPDTLVLTSSLIPADLLEPPTALSLAFTNLLPDLAIVGTTIAPFAASFAGTVSSTEVPEPAVLGLLAIMLLGAGLARRRRF